MLFGGIVTVANAVVRDIVSDKHRDWVYSSTHCCVLVTSTDRRGVGEGGAGGAVAPPILKARGLSPSSFSHLFVLWLLHGDYYPIIRICNITIVEL